MNVIHLFIKLSFFANPLFKAGRLINFKQCLEDCKAHDDCPGEINCWHGFCAQGATKDDDPTPFEEIYSKLLQIAFDIIIPI